MSKHNLFLKSVMVLALLTAGSLSSREEGALSLSIASDKVDAVNSPDKIDIPISNTIVADIPKIDVLFPGDDNTTTPTVAPATVAPPVTTVAPVTVAPTVTTVTVAPPATPVTTSGSTTTGSNTTQTVTPVITNHDITPPPPVDINKHQFGEDEDLILDESMIASDQINNGRIFADMVDQATQPWFFTSTGFSYESFSEMWPENLSEFVQFTGEMPLVGKFKSDPEHYTREFIITGTETGEWCFVTFTDLTAKDYEVKEYKFFFDHASAMTNQKVWFREVDEECPSIQPIPPTPPTVKKCNLYYKRTEADYDFVVKLLGPKVGSDLMKCILKATLTLQNQPNIELMCSFEAVTDNAWKCLTKEDLESFDADLEKNDNGKYVMNHTGEKFMLEAEKKIVKKVKPKVDMKIEDHAIVSAMNDNGGVVNVDNTPVPVAAPVAVTVPINNTGGD